MIFVTALNRPGAVGGIAKIRKLASVHFGRDSCSIKVITGASDVGRTHDEALENLGLERMHCCDEEKAVELADYELNHYVDIPTSASLRMLIRPLQRSPLMVREGQREKLFVGYDRNGLFVGTPEEISHQEAQYIAKYDTNGLKHRILQ